jgi:hypothetical protein
MWPASDNRAKLLVIKPAISSAKKYTALIAKAQLSRRVSLCRAIALRSSTQVTLTVKMAQEPRQGSIEAGRNSAGICRTVQFV